MNNSITYSNKDEVTSATWSIDPLWPMGDSCDPNLSVPQSTLPEFVSSSGDPSTVGAFGNLLYHRVSSTLGRRQLDVCSLLAFATIPRIHQTRIQSPRGTTRQKDIARTAPDFKRSAYKNIQTIRVSLAEMEKREKARQSNRLLILFVGHW